MSGPANRAVALVGYAAAGLTDQPPNAAPFGICAVCARWRPVYPEPDGTEVCLDDYETRNGGVL